MLKGWFMQMCMTSVVGKTITMVVNGYKFPTFFKMSETQTGQSMIKKIG